MIKEAMSIRIDVNIDLPEGDKKISAAEKQAILDRIRGYITELGITSDCYEGGMAGKLSPMGALFELEVYEVPAKDPTKTTVEGILTEGVCQKCGCKED